MKLNKQIFMRLGCAVVLLMLAFSVLALAQSSPPPAPSATPAIVSSPASPSGLGGLVQSKGGLVAFITLCVLSLNALMSGVRLMLLKWDGVNPGDPIPADDKALTVVNKICIVAGQIMDFFGQNTQH